MSDWRPIKTFRGPDYRMVDIWMQWGASAMTMGMADAFRVVEAYRKNGKWVHRNPMNSFKEEELVHDYITHWMPTPKAPR
jgi:hypothetical protein